MDKYLASRLGARITFQRVVTKGRRRDGSPKDPRWEDYKSVWAEVITIGGEEGRLAAADSMQVRYRITIRHREDIDPSMRVKLARGKTVEIKSIRDPDGSGVMLEINGLDRQGDV